MAQRSGNLITSGVVPTCRPGLSTPPRASTSSKVGVPSNVKFRNDPRSQKHDTVAGTCDRNLHRKACIVIRPARIQMALGPHGRVRSATMNVSSQRQSDAPVRSHDQLRCDLRRPTNSRYLVALAQLVLFHPVRLELPQGFQRILLHMSVRRSLGNLPKGAAWMALAPLS